MKRFILFTLLLVSCFNLGFSLETTTNPTSDYPKVQLSGFARIRYTADQTAGKNDSFTNATARFGLKGNISKDVSFTFSLETTNTDTANNKAVYDTYMDLKSIPHFATRIGQFKYKFSLEQCTPDADLELINKSDVVNTLVKPTRDLGIEIAKNFSLFSVKSDLALTLVNGSGSNQEDENQHKTVIGRIVFSPFKGLDFGGSIYDGEVSSATGGSKAYTKRRTGLEVKYEIKRFFSKAEYLQGKDDSVYGSLPGEGYYLTAGYTLFPSTVLLLRYDTYDYDAYDRTQKKVVGYKNSRWTVGVNYFLDKNVLLRNNYEIKEESPSIKNNLLMTQLQVKF